MMQLFSTREQKRERNFAIICQTFEERGVDTVEEAQRCRATMHSNAKVYTLFVVMLGVLLAIIFHSALIPILIGVGVLSVYIWTSTFRGRDLVQRYIDEVLEADKPQDPE